MMVRVSKKSGETYSTSINQGLIVDASERETRTPIPRPPNAYNKSTAVNCRYSERSREERENISRRSSVIVV